MTAPSLQNYTNGRGQVTADNLNTFQQTCDTFADLRAFVGTTGMQIAARGGAAINDGAQDVFYWDALSYATDDDATVLVPLGAGPMGRWILLPPVAPVIATPPVNVNLAGRDASLALVTVQDTTRTVASQFELLGVDLADFGAPLNGTDSDLPAFQALCARYPNGYIRITWNGYAVLPGGLVIPAGMSNVKLAAKGYTAIYAPSHTYDMLTLPSTVGGWTIEGLAFLGGSAPTGATRHYGLNSSADGLVTTDLYMDRVHSGILSKGDKTYYQGRTHVSNMCPAQGVAVSIDQGTNEVVEVQNLYAENAPGADAYAGVEVLSCSSAVIGGIAAKCGVPLLLNPAAGEIIATLRVDGFNGDTSASHGMWATGAGTIQRLEGHGRWSSNAGCGARFDNIPMSADVDFRAVDNADRGVYLATAGDYHNSRLRIAGWGNGTQGFEAASGAVNWTAQVVGGNGDGFGGNAQYSAVVGASCDHFTLDVDGVGDTLGLLYNGAGTSATKVIRSRN